MSPDEIAAIPPPEERDRLITAALKEARKSVAALLLEVPHEVWVAHKGTVENAISLLVEDRLEARAQVALRDALLDQAQERALRAALAVAERKVEMVTMVAEGAERERDKLRLLIAGVVSAVDDYVGGCCGEEAGDGFCEQYGCGTLLDLVLPLRAALAGRAEEAT